MAYFTMTIFKLYKFVICFSILICLASLSISNQITAATVSNATVEALSQVTKASSTKVTSVPTTTITTITTKKAKKKSRDYDDDEDEDDEGIFASVNKPRVASASVSNDADEVEEEKGTSSSTDEEKSDTSKNADDEDYEEAGESCDGRLSTFVRAFDGSAFLPDDYEEVSEFVHKHGAHGHVKSINDTMAIFWRQIKILEKVRDNKDLADAAMYLSSVFADKMYQAELSPNCMADLLAIGNGIRNFELWALRFLDSFGLPFGGLLHDHWSSFGQFDQCINIKSPKQENGRIIYGQYCAQTFKSFTVPIELYTPHDEEVFDAHPSMALVMTSMKKVNLDKYFSSHFAKFQTQVTDRIDKNMFHNGMCFPNSCSAAEIEKLYNELFYPLVKFGIRMPEELCEQHPELKVIQLDNYQKASLIILAIITGIALLSTFAHLFIGFKTTNQTALNSNDQLDILPEQVSQIAKPKPLYQQVILSFSLIQNITKLFTISPYRYASLDTLRVILSLLIFPINSLGLCLMHFPTLYRHGNVDTRMEILASSEHWLNRVPGLWFDGFVFLFAVLTIFQQFKLLKRSFGEFSYLTYILQRWFRLSIAVFGSILFIYLLPLSGNGPMWFFNEQYVAAPCKRLSSLLSTFLYYSNWNDPLDDYAVRSTLNVCNPPTWFLSSFSQLYLIAPIIFLPLYYWPRFGVSLTIFAIFLSPLFTALPRLAFGYPSYMETIKFTAYDSRAQAVTHSHMNPLLYVTSLTIGLFTGYLIKCKPNINFGGKIIEMLLWLLSLSSVVLIFLWNNTFWVEQVYHSTESIVGFFIYYKLAWSIFLGYTTYLCCTGRGCFLSQLLNLPSLQPLAKLSFCIYLLRSLMIFYQKTSVRHTTDMYPYRSFKNILCDFIITAIGSVVLHLLFEAPALRIATIFEAKDDSEQLNRSFAVSNENITEKDVEEQKIANKIDLAKNLNQ